MTEMWLLNPRKARKMVRKKRRVNRRPSRKQIAARKRFVTMARARRRKSPRKRSRSRRRARSNPIMTMNPRRRRRRSTRRKSSRSYRRNPPAMRGMMNDVMFAAVGYMGTKFAVGAVLPAIGIAANPPSLTGIAAKMGVAYGVAFLGEKFIGSGKFQPIFIGGVVSAIQDIVTLYIAPSVPALGMGAYYRPSLPSPRLSLPGAGMGAYVDNSLGAEDML